MVCSLGFENGINIGGWDKPIRNVVIHNDRNLLINKGLYGVLTISYIPVRCK